MKSFEVQDAPELVALARRDVGLTQAELAARAGMTQPNLAAIERGKRAVSPELLNRILEAADYRPSVALLRVREQVLAEMPRFGVRGVSVFGSASRGEDHFNSDLDLLLDADRADSLRAAGFMSRVEELTGFPVDGHFVSSATTVPFGRAMLAEAVPL